ncbi:MAG: glycosyltransferase family 2 protein [Candidatus Bathyarchaeota archaeon]|nr:glycosyltransferase family 2 protein [Candidatus Bathyarchaeota archaeon]
MISVVIPVFNEEPTVGNVIERLKVVLQKTGLNHEIIVVDDFSHDNSVEVAKRHNILVYRLKQHRGKGYALRVGFAKANGDIVATIDSDGSHRPEELSRLLKPLLADEADLVIGSRFMNAHTFYAKRINAAGNRLFNFLIHFLIRSPITDSQSGYRVMTRQVLRCMKLWSVEYEIESEMLVKTAKNHFRIKEVPISFVQRTYGRSHVDPLVDGLKILISIISAYLRS